MAEALLLLRQHPPIAPHTGMKEGLLLLHQHCLSPPHTGMAEGPLSERGAGGLASAEEEAFPQPSGAPAIFLNRRYQVSPVNSLQGGCQGIIFHFLLATVKYLFNRSKALVRAKQSKWCWCEGACSCTVLPSILKLQPLKTHIAHGSSSDVSTSPAFAK